MSNIATHVLQHNQTVTFNKQYNYVHYSQTKTLPSAKSLTSTLVHQPEYLVSLWSIKAFVASSICTPLANSSKNADEVIVHAATCSVY